MKREELKKLGLNDEQIEAVMKSHGLATGELTQNVTALTTERDSLQTQVSTYETQLSEIKGDAEAAPALREKIEKIEAEQAKAKTESEAEKQKISKAYEVRLGLLDANARNAKAVMALIDDDLIDFDKSGKLTGLTEQIERIKADESTSFLFQSAEESKAKPKITIGQNATGASATGEVDPFEAILEKI